MATTLLLENIFFSVSLTWVNILNPTHFRNSILTIINILLVCVYIDRENILLNFLTNGSYSDFLTNLECIKINIDRALSCLEIHCAGKKIQDFFAFRVEFSFKSSFSAQNKL